MRFKLLFLFLLVCLGVQAQTNVIFVKTGGLNSGNGSPNLKGLKVVLTDTSVNPRMINGIFISPQPWTVTTLSSGIAYFTNVIWGIYDVKLSSFPEVHYTIQVETNTTGLVDAGLLTSITNQPNPLSSFYTIAQVDTLLSDVQFGLTNLTGDVTGYNSNNNFSAQGLGKITNILSAFSPTNISGTLTNNTTGNAAASTNAQIAAVATNAITATTATNSPFGPFGTAANQPATAFDSSGSYTNYAIRLGSVSTLTPVTSNLFAGIPLNSTLSLPPGTFDAGSNAIWLNPGSSIQGAGMEATTIIIYNTSADGTTNGGSLAVPDNCNLSDFYWNQTNSESWCIAPIGYQRKNQTSPVQTAQNLAATSTNVIIRNLKMNGAKTGTIILNCTNTFNWKIFNCELSANNNEALAIGLAGTTGDGTGAIPVTNTNDVVEVTGTSVESRGTVSSFLTCVKVDFSGNAKIQLKNVNVMGSGITSGYWVAGTNATIHISITGAQTHPNSTAYYSLLLSGSTNTVICEGGIFNVLDQGTANNICYSNQPVTSVFAGGSPTISSNTVLVASNAISGSDRAMYIGMALSSGVQQNYSNYTTITLSKATSTNAVGVLFSPYCWGPWTNTGAGTTFGATHFHVVNATSNSFTFQTTGGSPPSANSMNAWFIQTIPQ